jgi:hypothetical protein
MWWWSSDFYFAEISNGVLFAEIILCQVCPLKPKVKQYLEISSCFEALIFKHMFFYVKRDVSAFGSPSLLAWSSTVHLEVFLLLWILS